MEASKLKRLIFSILLFISFNASAQYTSWLNVKSAPFSAVGDGIADDYAALQACIDSAVKVNGTVYIPQGIYSISAPLICYRWSGTAYAQVYINIVGEDMMLSPGITVIKPTFKNAFALGFHLNKGTIVRGITFEGLYNATAHDVDRMYKSPITYNADPTSRTSRYSPYSALAVDPFRGVVPPDGGYPGLTTYYRGPVSASGSTGIQFYDINIRNFALAVIVSPNGQTLNGELLTFENFWVKDVLVGLASCQAQEKGNRVINWLFEGRCRIAFSYAQYGQGQIGHYIVDGVVLKQDVVDFIYRTSAGYFAAFYANITAIGIGRIGVLGGATKDAIINSSFTFIHPDTSGVFMSPLINYTSMVAFMNVQLRYAGHPEIPLLMGSNAEIYNTGNDSGFANVVWGRTNLAGVWSYNYGYTSSLLTAATIINWWDDGIVRRALINDVTPGAVGDNVFFLSGSVWIGQGIVTAVTPGANYTVSYISPTVLYGGNYSISKHANALVPQWKPNNINGTANVYDTTLNTSYDTTINIINIIKKTYRRRPNS
jgi:hypothetical protein